MFKVGESVRINAGFDCGKVVTVRRVTSWSVLVDCPKGLPRLLEYEPFELLPLAAGAEGAK